MDLKKAKEILECNEPIFMYKGKEYGICFLGNKYVAGETVTEAEAENEKDEIFDSLEQLFTEWKIEGVAFGEILKELDTL